MSCFKHFLNKCLLLMWNKVSNSIMWLPEICLGKKKFSYWNVRNLLREVVNTFLPVLPWAILQEIVPCPPHRKHCKWILWLQTALRFLLDLVSYLSCGWRRTRSWVGWDQTVDLSEPDCKDPIHPPEAGPWQLLWRWVIMLHVFPAVLWEAKQ